MLCLEGPSLRSSPDSSSLAPAKFWGHSLTAKAIFYAHRRQSPEFRRQLHSFLPQKWSHHRCRLEHFPPPQSWPTFPYLASSNLPRIAFPSWLGLTFWRAISTGPYRSTCPLCCPWRGHFRPQIQPGRQWRPARSIFAYFSAFSPLLHFFPQQPVVDFTTFFHSPCCEESFFFGDWQNLAYLLLLIRCLDLIWKLKWRVLEGLITK